MVTVRLNEVPRFPPSLRPTAASPDRVSFFCDPLTVTLAEVGTGRTTFTCVRPPDPIITDAEPTLHCHAARIMLPSPVTAFVCTEPKLFPLLTERAMELVKPLTTVRLRKSASVICL